MLLARGRGGVINVADAGLAEAALTAHVAVAFVLCYGVRARNPIRGVTR